jgi:hypothetical protein
MLGQYRFLNNQVSGTQVAVLFGVKAPTGANLVDPFREVFEAGVPTRIGLLGCLFGAAFSQRLSPRPRLPSRQRTW